MESFSLFECSSVKILGKKERLLLNSLESKYAMKCGRWREARLVAFCWIMYKKLYQHLLSLVSFHPSLNGSAMSHYVNGCISGKAVQRNSRYFIYSSTCVLGSVCPLMWGILPCLSPVFTSNSNPIHSSLMHSSCKLHQFSCRDMGNEWVHKQQSNKIAQCKMDLHGTL